MIDLDGLDPEALALALGGRIVDDDPWSIRERRERDAEYFRAMAALQRRERRERLAREIAVVKTIEKAGLPVGRAGSSKASPSNSAGRRLEPAATRR